MLLNTLPRRFNDCRDGKLVALSNMCCRERDDEELPLVLSSDSKLSLRSSVSSFVKLLHANGTVPMKPHRDALRTTSCEIFVLYWTGSTVFSGLTLMLSDVNFERVSGRCGIMVKLLLLMSSRRKLTKDAQNRSSVLGDEAKLLPYNSSTCNVGPRVANVIGSVPDSWHEFTARCIRRDSDDQVAGTCPSNRFSPRERNVRSGA